MKSCLCRRQQLSQIRSLTLDMKINIDVDENLLKQVREISQPGLSDDEIVTSAFREYIRSVARIKLIELGGSMPEFPDITRRRVWDE